jgi:flagellar basal-body rod modification protein FlgD
MASIPIVNPLVAAASATSGASITGTSELGQEDFLDLLITELANQDPMDPLADRDFIAQVAQLNTLSQTMKLNENLETMQMLQAASLVGHQVEAVGPDGERVAGTVTGVWFTDSQPYLVIDDDVAVGLEYVVRIT